MTGGGALAIERRERMERMEDIEVIRPDPDYIAIVREILAQNRLILEMLCKTVYKVRSTLLPNIHA